MTRRKLGLFPATVVFAVILFAGLVLVGRPWIAAACTAAISAIIWAAIMRIYVGRRRR